MTVIRDKTKEILLNYYPVTEDSIHLISEISNALTLNKGEFFIYEHRQDFNEYFVLNGVCRSFLYDTEGNDTTITFYDEGKVIAPHLSRTINNVSTLNFECLTDCEIGYFPANQLRDLMDKNDEIRRFAYSVLQHELLEKTDKEICNASLPAKQRLIKFREKFKSLENRIFHPTIASYLGITSISLSRLRKDLMNE